MRREGYGSFVVFLWWSVVGFAALMATLAFGNTYLFSIVNSSADPPAQTPLDILLAVAVPAIPSAALSWWLIVVLPRRSSAFAGGCAGLLTVILTVLGVYVVAFFVNTGSPSYITSLPVWEKLEGALYFWLFGLLALSAQPWGWEMFLVGVGTGALYGARVGALARRYLPSPYAGQPAPHSAPEGANS